MGAIIAETSEKNQQYIYDFGVEIGLAFQLQDDYLDAFGDENFGKKIGGDIIENKKTILYLKALELANENQRKQLLQWYNTTEESDEKISKVKQLFKDTNAATQVREAIAQTTKNALSILEKLSISEEKVQYLKDFSLDLMERNV